MEILRTENLTKKYSAHTALNKVSISIPENSIFGLLGPNGAGKTSFIRILTQIIGPDEGEVFFKGQKLSASHIPSIGYLPEERGLYKKMRVGEQLIYLSRLKGLSVKDAKESLTYWIDRLGLSSWVDKNIEDLSKGMQQKVQFIATVMHDPKLIILDEPFSGFDPINAELIKNEILEFKRKGSTIILSTHRMESVEELCDNIAVLDYSVKILDGSIQEIKQQFKSDFYLVECKGKINESEYLKIISQKSISDGRIQAKIKYVGNSSTNAIIKELMASAEMISFREEVPSIHDIFIHKVKEKNE